MAGLRTYRAKRDFGKTPEPRGTSARGKGFRYVIQKHDARRLHYDLRLELDGVMMSWAVTRGPSLVPGDKRLAIHVEDHPIEYNTFEGTIPQGEYGGGTVMIWDQGHWSPDHDPHKGMQKGHLDFELKGKKLKGHWHLVRMRKRPGERQEPWLLIKAGDDHARSADDPDVLEEMPDSAASDRSMDEIAADASKVWHSHKKPAVNKLARLIERTAARQRARDPKGPAKAKRNRPAPVRRAAKGQRVPAFIKPSLATLMSAAPEDDGWVHEVKFDGYRIQARIAHGTVSLKTRTGLDWTKRFPTIAEACDALAQHDAILDGEIVSVDANGVSDFSALQDDLKSGRHDRLVYYVFDLPHLDGADMTGTGLIERKKALASLLASLPADGVIRYSESFETSGATMLKHARDLQLEGIISKRRDAPYRSGRVGDWLKIKCLSSQELIVIGYEPSQKRRIRSLLLGYYEGGKLRYAGRVGTGWGNDEERELLRKLAAIERKQPPVDPVPEEERRRRVTWVAPEMVVEIEFRGWTGGALVRQASFKGVREDKPARQVVREIVSAPGAAPKRAAARRKTARRSGVAKSPARPAGTNAPVSVAGIPLSHPERIYWDDAGVTKAMLAEHYAKVWDLMQPHVTGRVVALLRCPEGVAHECFFQKHATAGIDTNHLHLVPEDGDRSIAVDGLDGLIALVQAGVLEIHVRGSSIDRLEDADRLVFDLDPGPGVEWKALVAAAREVRDRLRELKLESFVKTTGGKGLHVALPVRPVPWEQAKNFCRGIAEAMAADSPDRFTTTIKKAARNNRIFVDYLRNSREATAIAPYSTRARPGATVATPVSWEELGAQKESGAFNVLNLPKRIARLRHDPWRDMTRIRQQLPAASGAPSARRKRA